MVTALWLQTQNQWSLSITTFYLSSSDFIKKQQDLYVLPSARAPQQEGKLHNVPDLNAILELFKQVSPYSSLMD